MAVLWLLPALAAVGAEAPARAEELSQEDQEILEILDLLENLELLESWDPDEALPIPVDSGSAQTNDPAGPDS